MTVTDDWVRVHRDAGDTELAAAEVARRDADARAERVCRAIGDLGDAIPEDVMAATGNDNRNSVAPLFTELFQRGLIFDTGDRRPNGRGNSCRVMAVSDDGWAWLRRRKEARG